MGRKNYQANLIHGRALIIKHVWRRQRYPDTGQDPTKMGLQLYSLGVHLLVATYSGVCPFGLCKMDRSLSTTD